MRKHRLFGVVIAVFVGMGALTHRSDSPHRTPGTDRAGMQLSSARLSVGDTSTSGSSATAHDVGATSAALTVASSVAHDVSVPVSTTPDGTILPFPFGAVEMVTNYRVVAQKKAAVNSYLTAVAQERTA